MRISRHVSFTAYTRTMQQLEHYGITEVDLPDNFYYMHWSERRRYIQANYGLFVCPRCRSIMSPDQKHSRKHLCQRCGDNTQHHIIHVPDESSRVGSLPAASIPESSTTPQPALTDIDEILRIAKGDK
jgi:hypothetical protein